MDKEYILLSEIEKNENITQRELSKKTELSLGSVNILLNKMIHEGLIKIKQIPMNRVAYMLTPVGLAEKVRKTGNYIKVHYKYINETTNKIKNILIKLIEQDYHMYILLEADEISELIKLAIVEINDQKHIAIIEDTQKLIQNNINQNPELEKLCGKIVPNEHKNTIILVQSLETYNELTGKQVNVINLLELL